MTGIYDVSKYRMKPIQPAYETVGIPISQLPPITVLPMVPRNEDPAISAARLEATKGKWSKMELKKHAKGKKD